MSHYRLFSAHENNRKWDMPRPNWDMPYPNRDMAYPKWDMQPMRARAPQR